MEIKFYLEEIDLKRRKIDKFRPLNDEILATLKEKLRLDWTYNSNAIEGNTLTLGETMFFLREGLTSEGKPLKDYLEAKNHAEAIDGLYEIISEKREITEGLIKQLHGVLMRGIEFTFAKNSLGHISQKAFHAGQYKIQPNHVLTISGKIHHYTEPLKVKDEMEELLYWYKKDKSHPVEKAAIFHYRFVRIHPFDDGNGRMARLLMNLILMTNGYYPCIIKNTHRKKYLESLEIVDQNHKYDDFIAFVAEELISTQDQIYDILSNKNQAKDDKYQQKSPNFNSEEREQMILKAFEENKKLSISQIHEKFPYFKRPTLKKDLKNLIEKGELKNKGVGKGNVYWRE